MRIAAVQMVSGNEVAANLEQAARLIAEAAQAGARFIALPENFSLMPRDDAARAAATEVPGSGPIQEFLAAQARAHGVWLASGTLPLWNATRSKARSACLLFDERGRQVARYDKMHLFDVKLPNGEAYEESRSFEPGTDVVVADSPLGPLGLAVCYDLRFPELFRRLVDQGAEWFCLPSAFTAPTGRAHWETLLRARAIENFCHVVAPAQSGFHENGRETYGDSMIVDCWGRVLARLRRGSGVVVAEIDLVRQREVRQNFPSLDHRRLAP
jgi:nitrilase